MKKLSTISVSLLALAVSGAVGANGHKEDMFHCGCNSDGTELVWSHLYVSRNTKGHQNHEAGDDEACYDVSASSWVSYTRGFDDCEEAGGPNIAGVSNCDSVSGDDFVTDATSFTAGDNCED